MQIHDEDESVKSATFSSVSALLLLSTLLWASCTCDPGATAGSDAVAPTESDRSGTGSGHVPDQANADRELPESERVDVPAIAAPNGATIIITSGVRGYTEPCGCSVSLQLGGIDRLAHVVRELSSRGSSGVIDAGDLFFDGLPLNAANRAQEIARAEVIADAARHMDVRWTVPGSYDLIDGIDTYRRLTERADVSVISSNGSAAFRERLDAVTHARVSIDGWEILVVGLTDPGTVEDRYSDEFRSIDASLSELRSRLHERTWDAAIVLFQGTAEAAQTLLRTSDAFSFDFVVIGKNTRPGSNLLNIANTHGIEVFDQAREVGALRLLGDPNRTSAPRWSSIESELDAKRAAVVEQLERTEEQIAVLRERLAGRESRLLSRMADRIDGYREELVELDSAQPDIAQGPGDRNAFYWQTIEVIPQFARDADVKALRVAFNESLRELNLANAPAPPPAVDGAPHLVGVETCKGCHQASHSFWQSTAHATAIDTLIERDKRFDTTCIGCHVTGFQMPGGSSLGHLDGLENVQCESCHGPGSAHAAAPTNVSTDVNVSLQVEASTCQGCHTAEHSPEFDYDNYLGRIIGAGHGLPSVE